MINEDTLAVVTKLAIDCLVLFLWIPGMIWLVIRYIEFLAWAGNL